MATVPSLLVQIGISATPRCFAFSADDLSFAKAGEIAVADKVKEINAATNAFVTSAPKQMIGLHNLRLSRTPKHATFLNNSSKNEDAGIVLNNKLQTKSATRELQFLACIVAQNTREGHSMDASTDETQK